MPKLVFLESFVLGHEVIDTDHRRLVEIINQLYALIEAGEIEEFPALLRKFIGVAASHFANEEQVLLEIKFPRFEAHCQSHRELLARANMMAAGLEHIDSRQSLRATLDSLVGFFVDDVLKSDYDFKSHLAQHNRAAYPLRSRLRSPLIDRGGEPVTVQ